MMDKKEAKERTAKMITRGAGDIALTDYGFAIEVIAFYEQLLNEPDYESWREKYRKKQAAGVKFQRKSLGEWKDPINSFDFSGPKEDYREAPMQSTIPYAAERALYWKQRAEGTNEVWQYDNMGDVWIDILGEPRWLPFCKYRQKPKTRTVYFALVRYQSCGLLVGLVNDSKEDIVTDSKASMFKIIGAIEQREVECD